LPGSFFTPVYAALSLDACTAPLLAIQTVWHAILRAKYALAIRLLFNRNTGNRMTAARWNAVGINLAFCCPRQKQKCQKEYNNQRQYEQQPWIASFFHFLHDLISISKFKKVLKQRIYKLTNYRNKKEGN